MRPFGVANVCMIFSVEFIDNFVVCVAFKVHLSWIHFIRLRLCVCVVVVFSISILFIFTKCVIGFSVDLSTFIFLGNSMACVFMLHIYNNSHCAHLMCKFATVGRLLVLYACIHIKP